MENVYLQEAFKALDILNEEDFNLDSVDGFKDAKEFIEDEDKIDFTDIIDPEADTKEELQDSYIGNVILDCCVCHSKIYKKPDEIEINEAEELVNIDEECPYCYSTDGYTIIGEIAPYGGEEDEESEIEETEVEEKEEKEEEVEECLTESAASDISEYQKWVDYDMKKYGRISFSTFNKIKKAGFSVVKDQYGDYEVIADRKEECLDECEKKKIKEHFEKVEIETDTEKMEMISEPDGKTVIVTEPKEEKEEVIAPVSDEIQTEINPIEEPEEEVEDEEEIDVNEFSEEDFDKLGESYLKKVYENVNSFKTSSIKSAENKLVVEGIIGFNSGKQKKTSFVFESKDVNKHGKVRFIGENLQLSRGKKAFTLTGSVDNGKFIAESLNYNYRQKDSEGKSNRVYGTVRK